MVEVSEKVQIPVNVHLDDTSSTVEPSVSKLGMVMHHHGPVSRKIGLLPSSWFAVFKFKVTVRAHIIRYDCCYSIY